MKSQELPAAVEVLAWQRPCPLACPGAHWAGLHTDLGRASAYGRWAWSGERTRAGRGSVSDGETPTLGEADPDSGL